MSSTLLGITTIGYLLCMTLYFCCLFFKSEKFGRIVTVLVMVVALVHTGLPLDYHQRGTTGIRLWDLRSVKWHVRIWWTIW